MFLKFSLFPRRSPRLQAKNKENSYSASSTSIQDLNLPGLSRPDVSKVAADASKVGETETQVSLAIQKAFHSKIKFKSWSYLPLQVAEESILNRVCYSMSFKVMKIF